MQTRDYAARKGTREKRLLAKKKRAKKVVVEQVGFVPYKQQKKKWVISNLNFFNTIYISNNFVNFMIGQK